MAKGKKPDFIEEVHERANNNINPYYYFNKINSFKIAEWRASLAFSVIETVLLTIALVFTLIVAYVEKSFSNYSLPIAAFGIIWCISIVRSIQWFSLKREQSKTNQHPKPKERKKKAPKHRKDYGR